MIEETFKCGTKVQIENYREEEERRGVCILVPAITVRLTNRGCAPGIFNESMKEMTYVEFIVFKENLPRVIELLQEAQEELRR